MGHHINVSVGKVDGIRKIYVFPFMFYTVFMA